jgi:hypothetical protein
LNPVKDTCSITSPGVLCSGDPTDEKNGPRAR